MQGGGAGLAEATPGTRGSSAGRQRSSPCQDGRQRGAAAQTLAELVLHGEFRSLDLGCFSHARLLRNEPLVEGYVVGGA